MIESKDGVFTVAMVKNTKKNDGYLDFDSATIVSEIPGKNCSPRAVPKSEMDTAITPSV